MNIKLFAVFSPEKEMLRIANQFIFTKNVGYLASFADWSVATAEWARKNVQAPSFADSGSFSAYTRDRALFLKNSMEDLAEFYEAGRFNIIVEPDVLEVSPTVAKMTAMLRSRKICQHLSLAMTERLIRPNQGNDLEERLSYAKFLKQCDLYQPNRVAIGGIAKANLDQRDVGDIAASLNKNPLGYKKIHLLGRTSETAIDIALSISDLGYDEVTMDSTSWTDQTVFSRTIWMFKGGEDGKPELSKFKFGVNAPTATKKSLKIVNECSCPICNTVLFAEDNGRSHKLGDLGLQSQKRTDEYYEKLFLKRGKLHNLYQQRLFLEAKIRNHVARKPTTQHQTFEPQAIQC